MSSNLVIVAIPQEGDRVWKISSEKIPHLTILHLGDSDEVSNLDQIMLFVKHAAETSLNRFWLPVDRRGELGEAKADVLFFRKGYDAKALRYFRSLLLKNDNIKTAYDAARQFETPEEVGQPGQLWIPHMTLGYPDSPAKPIPDDQLTIYDVNFDKIAAWDGDFSGPEFLLKDQWEDEMDSPMDVPLSVAMSDIQHFGVKGMRWGVSKEDVGGAAKTVGKGVVKGAKAVSTGIRDANFEVRLENENKHAQIQQEISSMARQAFRRTDLPALKERHGDYGKMRNRAKKPFSKEARAYRKDARETYIKRVEDAANSMTNASQTRQYTIRERGWELPAEGGALPKSKHYWGVTSREIKHADGNEVTAWVEVVMDEDGYIADLQDLDSEPTKPAMAHVLDKPDLDILEHHGVKGMKWGVRKEEVAGGGHIRVSKRTNVAAISSVAQVGFLTTGPAAFLSPRFRREFKAAGAHNKQVKKEKKLAKKDKKWEKQVYTVPKAIEVHNAMADHFNPRIEAINNKPEYKNLNLFQRPDEPAAKKYLKEVNDLTMEGNRLGVEKVHGRSPSGKKKAVLSEDGNSIKIVEDKVKHAADDDENYTIEFMLRYDDDGKIVEMNKAEEAGTMTQSAEQTMDLGVEFLEHFGVKGMRWGQRKAPPDAVAVSSKSVVPHGKKRKTKIKAEGGENHDAHEDAIKVAEARQKLGRSGSAALSNKELRDVANRLQLEQQVAALTSNKGQRFVQRQLEQEGQHQFQKNLRRGVRAAGPVAAKKIKKGAATAAVAAVL